MLANFDKSLVREARRDELRVLGVRLLSKTQPDEIQSFLSDASYLQGGWTERVVFPETALEVSKVLAEAYRSKTPVTVSGAGTGTVGGRIPFGGVVIATDKLNRIQPVTHADVGGSVVAEAGVVLADLQRAVEAEDLFYPPDPTERGCFLGGTISTNASGARTFKYGPTRRYVQRLRVALANGQLLDLKRGEVFADKRGLMEIPLPDQSSIRAQLPTYVMPQTRKHACGYYVASQMDAIDMFIGSEGTLGVVVEAEVKLLPPPEGILSGIVFFESDERLLSLVAEARGRSLESRADAIASPAKSPSIDARALEYFDVESLRFLRQKYDAIPANAVGALFFEQETTSQTEDLLMSEWLSLLDDHHALSDESWFATNQKDQARLREFRHQLPVLMNEWFARHSQRKVSTDMAVPDAEFAGMLDFYRLLLDPTDLRYTIFGHIGDNHVHVNILPRHEREAAVAREIYLKFIRKAVTVGGTISAEHGIGKLKREYLRELYGDKHLREMAVLKHAFDPGGILGRGNIFSESMISK